MGLFCFFGFFIKGELLVIVKPPPTFNPMGDAL